jgi:hypothetical protein
MDLPKQFANKSVNQTFHFKSKVELTTPQFSAFRLLLHFSSDKNIF